MHSLKPIHLDHNLPSNQFHYIFNMFNHNDYVNYVNYFEDIRLNQETLNGISIYS